VAPVTIWEDPVFLGKACWPGDVALIICVRLTPNDGGVLNRGADVEDVEDVTLNAVVDTAEALVIESERVPLKSEETRLPQDVGLPVIRMIPEPT